MPRSRRLEATHAALLDKGDDRLGRGALREAKRGTRRRTRRVHAARRRYAHLLGAFHRERALVASSSPITSNLASRLRSPGVELGDTSDEFVVLPHSSPWRAPEQRRVGVETFGDRRCARGRRRAHSQFVSRERAPAAPGTATQNCSALNRRDGSFSSSAHDVVVISTEIIAQGRGSTSTMFERKRSLSMASNGGAPSARHIMMHPSAHMSPRPCGCPLTTSGGLCNGVPTSAPLARVSSREPSRHGCPTAASSSSVSGFKSPCTIRFECTCRNPIPN